MRPKFYRGRLGMIGIVALSLLRQTHADQIEMVNGDRYQGKIISLNSNEVVMNSDMLGLVKVPRGKVSGITAGAAISPAAPGTATKQIVQSPPAVGAPTARTPVAAVQVKTNTSPGLNLSELQTNTALAKQVQSKYLAEAGPEATAKYNEMLKDLFSGKMSIADLRGQAKRAADQLRGYKKELGSEAGSELDEYLAILDKFVNEAAEDDVKSTAASPALKKSTAPNE